MKSFWKLILIIGTFGIVGDYNVIRYYTLKCKLFWPLYKLFQTFHCAYLPLTNVIEGYITLPHSVYGCFFSRESKIGKGCIIMQHVTIGSNYWGGEKSNKVLGAPEIGNNVFVGAGAKIIGKVKIGDGAKIGAGCIVVEDVPPNAVCVMNKPRIITK